MNGYIPSIVDVTYSGEVQATNAGTYTVTVEFDYEYKAYGSDNFIVDVLLESEDGNTIGTKGNLSLSEGKGIVSISYSDKRIKASRIKIRFESGSNKEFQAIRGNLDDWSGNADTRFVGSVLTLDNIKLIYDDYE